MIKKDGTIWTNGSNWAGSLCIGNFYNRDEPTQVTTLPGSISYGFANSISTTMSNGSDKYSCGYNGGMSLGVADTAEKISTPQQVIQ